MGYITPEALTGQISCRPKPNWIQHVWWCLSEGWRSSGGLWQVAGKFPGYLSPSNKLLFSDIPNGLAAISKARFAAFQILTNDRKWLNSWTFEMLLQRLAEIFLVTLTVPSTRFHWRAGFRSSATALTVRSQQDMMQILPSALLVTWDGTHLSFPETTLRPRPGDWMPSWRTDALLWWPSSACFSRHGGSVALQVNINRLREMISSKVAYCEFFDWMFRSSHGKSLDEKLQSQRLVAAVNQSTQPNLIFSNYIKQFTISLFENKICVLQTKVKGGTKFMNGISNDHVANLPGRCACLFN